MWLLGEWCSIQRHLWCSSGLLWNLTKAIRFLGKSLLIPCPSFQWGDRDWHFSRIPPWSMTTAYWYLNGVTVCLVRPEQLLWVVIVLGPPQLVALASLALLRQPRVESQSLAPITIWCRMGTLATAFKTCIWTSLWVNSTAGIRKLIMRLWDWRFSDLGSAISKGCKGLVNGDFVCVAAKSSPSASASASSTSAFPTQTGVVHDCKLFFLVMLSMILFSHAEIQATSGTIYLERMTVTQYKRNMISRQHSSIIWTLQPVLSATTSGVRLMFALVNQVCFPCSKLSW